MLTITYDAPTKIVGDNITYTFTITVPMGLMLESFYALIVMPNFNQFLGTGTLNGGPVTVTQSGNYLIFPPITNIDSTAQALSYEYEVSCNVANAVINNQIPTHTIETFYGNISYTTMLSDTILAGNNNSVVIQHPYMTITTTNSQTMSNYVKYLVVSNSPQIYTKVILENKGLTETKNITSIIVLPQYLTYQSVATPDVDTTVSYDATTRNLTLLTTHIGSNTTRTLVLQSIISIDEITGTVMNMTSRVESYYNDVSTTVNYITSAFDNSQLYFSSLFSFVPDPKYTVPGMGGVINISPRGVATQIVYYLTNLAVAKDSYRIQITPAAIPYDIYVDNNHVASIQAGQNANITDSLLANYMNNEKHEIALRYTVATSVPGGFYDSIMVQVSSLLDESVSVSIATGIQDP